MTRADAIHVHRLGEAYARSPETHTFKVKRSPEDIADLGVKSLLEYKNELEQLIRRGVACSNTYANYIACQREIKRRIETPETLSVPKRKGFLSALAALLP